MECWHCQKSAVGACRFCGRGICADHVTTRPFIVSLLRGGRSEPDRALVVEDALFCGACRPRPDLVDLPDL